MEKFLKRISSSLWIADGIALLGGVFYGCQLWSYTHSRLSVLDEGAYLYKGYLFATGQYNIYQDYGPWSNHMPLSFLIPGYVQRFFRPGLDVGRYFAVLVAVLIMLGFWLLVRRLGGRWWAAAAVWAFAWNPALVKMYSPALSQGLVACALIWTLVLVLGEGRSLWQIALGSFLAGIMVMIRINMIPILPLLSLYAFWQGGRKAGVVATLASGFTFLLGHALFWPDILQLWAYWLPREISPFLNDYRLPEGYQRFWDPQVSPESRLLSLLYSVRLHFTAVTGVLVTWLLWPRGDRWKRRSDFRAAVFLSALFLSFYLVHIWATLGNNYCVFCLPGYMAFFSPLGLILVVLSFTTWRQKLPAWYQLGLVVLIIGLCTGIGYASFEKIGAQLLEIQFPGIFLTFPRPSAGFHDLSKILSFRYGLKFADQRRVVSFVAGALAGILILFLALAVRLGCARLQKDKPDLVANRSPSFGYLTLVILLVGGSLLAPTLPLGGGKNAFDCPGGDTIRSYQAAGEHLAGTIPAGSRVYWMGSLSAVPLLYLPGVKIYPPQLNGDYSYYISGEADTLLRLGFWNRELNQRWLDEADYILVQDRFYEKWIERAERFPPLEELTPSPPTAPCLNRAQIHILKRKNDSP